MIAYKLFKIRKNGTIGPLFINARAVLPVGEWMEAEEHPTKGYAYRPGWHATLRPEAPHLSERGRAWYRVEVDGTRLYNRPESQGGTWVLAKRMKILEAV